MNRFPMLDPPFQVQSKKQDFMQKIFVQFGRSNRLLLIKSACMFYQKDDDKKKKKKKMSTHNCQIYCGIFKSLSVVHICHHMTWVVKMCRA